MKTVRSFSFVVASIITSALLADGLVKYKDWAASPQGYFMTRAERAQWSAIKTDAEAEQFVIQFIAGHGPGFVDEVAKRAQMADKYLTLGKTPGSKTLRGKIVILLGPPQGMSVTSRRVAGERSSTASAYMAASGDAGGSSMSGPSMADMAAAAQREGMSGKEVRDYNFTYTGSKLPAPQASDFVVTVEADAVSGADRITDKKQAAQLDQVFEAAAVAGVKH